MSYTFLNQKNKLSSLLGDPNYSADDQFPQAIREKEINRGELQFAKDAKNLLEYATGTVSSMTIAIPSDWLETYVLIVNGVVITNDREIALADWERYETAGTSDPYYYYWEVSGTRQLNLLGNSSSVNGQTYKLFYFKKPTTELSADADVSLHPEEYREASVYYAASELMKQIGKHEQANLFRAQYQYLVDQAKVDIGRKYIRKEYARPDMGEGITDWTTDIQGRGWPY